MSPMILNPYRFAASGGAAATNLQAATGGFTGPNSATSGTTVSVTGLAFQPKLVLLWMMGAGAASDTPALVTTNAAFVSFGMFTGTEQYAWGSFHNDAATTSLVGGLHRTDACLIQSGGSSTAWRALTFTSMNSDGFTVQIGTTNTGQTFFNLRIQYLALGGSDLANVKIGTVTVTGGATGNESYTPLAFTPSALIFPSYNAALSTYTANAVDSLGFATGASEQVLWGGFSKNGSNFTDACRYLRSDECSGLANNSSGSMAARHRFVSMDATGWTHNRLESLAANYTQPYCALSGVNVKAGTFTAASGGGSVTGVGFTPKAVLFLTHGTTESTADTTQTEFLLSIGASVTGITQRAESAHDIHNLDTSSEAMAVRNDGVAVTTSTAAAVDSVLAISSHDSDGFTYTMPTSTNNGYLVGYLALG